MATGRHGLLMTKMALTRSSTSTARWSAGSTGVTVVPLRTGPVVPFRTGFARSVRRAGRKIGQKMLRFGRNKWNWALKIWGIVDQHQRQQICGSKPQKTQQIRRSKFRALFWDIFQIFAKEKFGGFGGWMDEIREKPKAADTI